MPAPTAVFAAIATVLTLGVLALVLRPLWPRRGATLAAVAVLTLATLALYRLVGTPEALDPANRTPPDTLPAAIAQLEARLQQQPDAVEGWRLLAQAYASAQQPDKARDAAARAARLAPDEPDVLVEAAEARALAAPERHFDAEGVRMLRHALQVQPQNQRARWFLGIAQRQAGHAAEAAATWEPLLAMVDPRTAAPLRTQIDAARQDAGLPPLPKTAVADAGQPLTVTVRLDPAVARRLAEAGDAARVFVIARAPGGPPMPIAVEKHTLAELPLTVTLDDADSPMPTQALSSMQEVEVLARLSLRGEATPQPGDLASAPVRVQLPATAPVELTLGAGD